MSVDTRVLGLFRIFFGIICFWDVYRRFHLIDVFYSSNGIDLSLGTVSNYIPQYFTLLHSFRSSDSLNIFFIITMIASICLMVGYRTKFSHFIVLIGIISIHNYRIILENGADLIMNSLLVWSFFLPLGKNISIDALISSLKENNDTSSSDLNRYKSNYEYKYLHFAYFAFLVQLAMIYTFNFINKTGKMWEEGTAVYYMFQLDTFITPLGSYLTIYINPAINYILTNLTMVVEFSSFIFILSPFLIGAKIGPS